MLYFTEDKLALLVKAREKERGLIATVTVELRIRRSARYGFFNTKPIVAHGVNESVPTHQLGSSFDPSAQKS